MRSRRTGRERLRKVEARRLEEVRGCLDRVSARWDDAITRLRAFVETDAP